MEEFTTTENGNNKTLFSENVLTIPPMETSRSSVRIKTMFGLGFILAAARLLQCKVTQMRIKCNITNGETIFDAELKTNKAMAYTRTFSCDKSMKYCNGKRCFRGAVSFPGLVYEITNHTMATS